jgi:hypothetical protein
MHIRSTEILVPPNSWVSLSGATTLFADRCLVKSIRTSHILSPRCRLAAGPSVPRSRAQQSAASCWMKRIGGLVGGAHAAFSDHSGSGMIELAGFDRSLTEYRNNSTEISGTDGSRLISGVEMHHVVAYGLGRFREGRLIQLAPFQWLAGS